MPKVSPSLNQLRVNQSEILAAESIEERQATEATVYDTD